MDVLRFRVVDKVAETKDSYSFFLKFLGEGDINYISGQYLPVKIPHEEGILFRSYSLSSSPNIDDLFRITVKREKGGKGSNWLCDNLMVDDVLESLSPAGDFFPKVWDTNFVFFAGGSGITPIFSIIKTNLLAHNSKIRLFYANSDKNSVIFSEELFQLQKDFPDRLSIDLWLDEENGIPTDSAFFEYIDKVNESQYFLCGPSAFMESVEKCLEKAAVPKSDIAIESFVGVFPDKISNGSSSSDKDITVRVLLNGEKKDIFCSENDFILAEMLRNGMNVPNSCGVGNCGSCICNLLHGEVILESNAVLDSSDEEDGWILACRSRPRSKYIEVSFDE